MTVPLKRKVMAYITHGDRLLVFREPDFPDAGIQVPGGTMEPGEAPDVAVMREAFEETGLSGLVLSAFLGKVQYDCRPRGRNEIHLRHYFHLQVMGAVADSWQHVERLPSEGKHVSILFEFFWVNLPDDVPLLSADMDEQVPELLNEMGCR